MLKDREENLALCPRCMSPLEGRGVCPSCGLDPAAYAPPRHHLLPGTILDGKYLVGCALGEGGFGITYMGWDLLLQTRVTLKEYFPAGIVFRDSAQSPVVSVFSGDGEARFLHERDRFLEEARALARFDGNPGIIHVKNYFRENGTAYIVMEHVPGVSLAALLEQNGDRLPLDRVLRLLEQPARALAQLHRQNTYHRDISPDNLIVTDGDAVRLIDFGSVRRDGQAKSQFLKVRPGFSPLELYAAGAGEGPYTDIYALSATLYRAVTGITPPPATDRVQEDALVPPRRAGVTDMTAAQERALLQGLAVRPQDRLQRVEDLWTALAGEAPVGAARRQRPRKRRAPAVAALLLLAVCLFFALRPRPLRLTRDMFADAPEIYECYAQNGVYPYGLVAYIGPGGQLTFTPVEDDLRWSQSDWRREPMTGKALARAVSALRKSGLPIEQLVLQNLRLESVEALGAPWPGTLTLIFDCCALPGDWSALAGMGDSLHSLHIGGEASYDDLSWMASLTALRWLALGGEGIDLEAVSRLDSLAGLSFGESGIRDLAPFARMKRLTSLCLPGNAVTDLSPLRGMPQLEELSLPGNDISDLTPLAELKNLKLVDVTGNRVRNFASIERDGIEIVGRDAQRP